MISKEKQDKKKGKEGKVKRYFIFCNGPSVNKFDMSAISKADVVISMNMVPDILPHLDYYCVSDQRFIDHAVKGKHFYDNIKKGIKTFISSDNKIDKKIEAKHNTNITTLKAIARDGFSCDINEGFYFGSTTLLMAMQVAFSLGGDLQSETKKECIIIGADFNYYELEEKNIQIRNYKEESPQAFDDLLTYQLNNVIQGSRVMREKNMPVFITSKNSFLRGYMPIWREGEVRENK